VAEIVITRTARMTALRSRTSWTIRKKKVMNRT